MYQIQETTEEQNDQRQTWRRRLLGSVVKVWARCSSFAKTTEWGFAARTRTVGWWKIQTSFWDSWLQWAWPGTVRTPRKCSNVPLWFPEKTQRWFWILGDDSFSRAESALGPRSAREIFIVAEVKPEWSLELCAPPYIAMHRQSAYPRERS